MYARSASFASENKWISWILILYPSQRLVWTCAEDHHPGKEWSNKMGENLFLLSVFCNLEGNKHISGIMDTTVEPTIIVGVIVRIV